MRLAMRRVAMLTTLAALTWMGNGAMDPTEPGFLMDSAEARRGRPVTPVSYAGVARRSTRRAVAVESSDYGATYGNPDGIGGPASGIGVLPGAGAGQAGVGYSRGAGANLGGPVNRVGVR
jgi:hypothetical protein